MAKIAGSGKALTNRTIDAIRLLTVARLAMIVAKTNKFVISSDILRSTLEGAIAAIHTGSALKRLSSAASNLGAFSLQIRRAGFIMSITEIDGLGTPVRDSNGRRVIVKTDRYLLTPIGYHFGLTLRTAMCKPIDDAGGVDVHAMTPYQSRVELPFGTFGQRVCFDSWQTMLKSPLFDAEAIAKKRLEIRREYVVRISDASFGISPRLAAEVVGGASSELVTSVSASRVLGAGEFPLLSKMVPPEPVAAAKEEIPSVVYTADGKAISLDALVNRLADEASAKVAKSASAIDIHVGCDAELQPGKTVVTTPEPAPTSALATFPWMR